MSAHNRVIWSEGLFLQPQHFQQQERYFERYVETRCRPLVPHGWGFTEIEFERDLLSIGKAALRRLAGVFPDGTPFRMPDDDPLPAPLDIGADVRDQILYLAIALRRPGEMEADRDAGRDDLVRHDVRKEQARNATSNSGDPAGISTSPTFVSSMARRNKPWAGASSRRTSSTRPRMSSGDERTSSNS